jgi:phage tail-like protein
MEKGFKATVLKYDPYRKFKFLVKWDDKYVAGVSKISALTKQVDPVDWRTGGDPNNTAKVPGLTKYEPITLERGLSADKAFMEWMNLVSRYQAAGGATDENAHKFRKNLSIEVYNLPNDKVMSVTVYNAWPSKLTVADFDAKANELAIEVLELQHEGWNITDENRPEHEVDER